MAAARVRAANVQNAVLSARLMNLFLAKDAKPITPRQLLRRPRRPTKAETDAAFDRLLDKLPEG